MVNIDKVKNQIDIEKLLMNLCKKVLFIKFMIFLKNQKCSILKLKKKELCYLDMIKIDLKLVKKKSKNEIKLVNI